MRMLMKTTEVYRVDTEEEAMEMIKEAKDKQIANNYTLSKSSYILKTKKAKGEIIDQYYLVSTERSFND